MRRMCCPSHASWYPRNTVTAWVIIKVNDNKKYITQPSAPKKFRSSSTPQTRNKLAWAYLPGWCTLCLIIAILGICQNCHVWSKESTIEVILFEYSRQVNQVALNNCSWIYMFTVTAREFVSTDPQDKNSLYSWTVGIRANAGCRRQKFCCGRPQRSPLGRYRPQSAVSCSTLRERAAWSSPNASQVSWLIWRYSS